MNVKNNIPNFLTLCNLALGFAAIAQCFSGSFDSMCQASYCLFAAALFDFFDGGVARLLKAQSAIGKQLDSLADAVSFGVAPGFILFQLLNYSLCKEGCMDAPGRYLVYFSVLVPVASALRLARFNTDPSQSVHFSGLPTPAMALVVATFPLALKQNAEPLVSALLLSSAFLMACTLALSALMVSSLRIFSLKAQPGPLKNKWHLLVLVTGTAVLSFKMGYAAGIPALLLYVLVSFAYFRTLRNESVPKE